MANSSLRHVDRRPSQEPLRPRLLELAAHAPQALLLVHASIRIPSSVKCSSYSRLAASVCWRTCSKNACATSPRRSRSQFWLNVLASHTRSPSSGPPTADCQANGLRVPFYGNQATVYTSFLCRTL